MSQSFNPLVNPIFSEHGREAWLETDLIGECADPRFKVSISNKPDESRIPAIVLLWLLCGVILDEATHDQLAREDVRYLMETFAEGMVRYKSRFSISYGEHDAMTYEEIVKSNPQLLEQLGDDIVAMLRDDLMDLYIISGKPLYNFDKSQARDDDFRLVFDKDGAPVMSKVYRYAEHTFDCDAHALWLAWFEDGNMRRIKSRITNKWAPRRFIGKVTRRTYIGKLNEKRLAIAVGELPTENCRKIMASPKRKPLTVRRRLNGSHGRGKIFLLEPEAFQMTWGSILRLHLEIMPHWLALNPSPLPVERDTRREAPQQKDPAAFAKLGEVFPESLASDAETQTVEDGDPKPRHGRGRDKQGRKPRRERAHRDETDTPLVPDLVATEVNDTSEVEQAQA